MFRRTIRSAADPRKFTQQLRALGAVSYDLWLPESSILPEMLHKNERVGGIVYGRYSQSANGQTGRGALVATDQRVMLIDKKPLFVHWDELIYGVVSAVTYTKAGVGGEVTLHTRMGDISVKTLNEKCARSFVKAIETNIFRDTGVSHGQAYDKV